MEVRISYVRTCTRGASPRRGFAHACNGRGWHRQAEQSLEMRHSYQGVHSNNQGAVLRDVNLGIQAGSHIMCIIISYISYSMASYFLGQNSTAFSVSCFLVLRVPQHPRSKHSTKSTFKRLTRNSMAHPTSTSRTSISCCDTNATRYKNTPPMELLSRVLPYNSPSRTSRTLSGKGAGRLLPSPGKLSAALFAKGR